MSDARMIWLTRGIGTFGLALLGATWRLWTPQSVFPQTPWFAWLGLFPAALDWMLLAAVIAALVSCVVLPAGKVSLRRLAAAAFVVLIAWLIAEDQQRFQPWAWQLLLTSLLVAGSPATTAARWLRALTVSIYVLSAISKFDYTFLHTLGQQFLAAMVTPWGGSLDDWSPHFRLLLAGLFPVVELGIAIGLCFPRSRRRALALSIMQHAMLIWILGPFGLQHRPSVLVWNAYFIYQNILLFGAPSASSVRESTLPLGNTTRATNRTARGIVTVAMTVSALEPLGLTDHWPGWSLYSPRVERVTVLVRDSAIERLPDAVAAHCQPLDDGTGLSVLKIDRWCLEAIGAPLYPQNRTQLAVALAVAQLPGMSDQVEVVRFGNAARTTGKRTRDELVGLSEISAATATYWYNARPSARFSPTLPTPPAAGETGPGE